MAEYNLRYRLSLFIIIFSFTFISNFLTSLYVKHHFIKKLNIKENIIQNYENLYNLECKPRDFVMKFEDILKKDNTTLIYNKFIDKIEPPTKCIIRKCSSDYSFCGRYSKCKTKIIKFKTCYFKLNSSFTYNDYNSSFLVKENSDVILKLNTTEDRECYCKCINKKINYFTVFKI